MRIAGLTVVVAGLLVSGIAAAQGLNLDMNMRMSMGIEPEIAVVYGDYYRRKAGKDVKHKKGKHRDDHARKGREKDKRGD